MKALIALAALLGVRLAFAGGACAQETPAPGGPAPPRLEVAASVGAIVFEPSAGILTSLRASKRSFIEGGANVTPHFVLTQAQGRVRLPWGPPGGARRSLVAGLTHVARRGGPRGTALDEGLAAHVGLSAQATVSRHVDVRTDVYMLMPFRDGPDAAPRAFLAVVIHP